MKKTILITGASGDIGSEICRFFIKNNYKVIGTYNKSKATIEALAEELGSDFSYYQCDLSDFNNAEKLFKNLGDISIDILVNNSGISVLGLLQDITDNEWIRLWNTNVTSAIAMSKMIIPIFLKQGYGKIINISSVWGQRGASYEVCYSTTKGAIDSFTKALAKELAPSNIQVNAISCGIIDTKMNGHLTQEDVDSIIEEIPASRLGTTEDVANAVYGLVNSGSYITGQIITVDGGWQV